MLPDGSSIRIDNVPATDASGYAGLQDKVDFHTWAVLKGVALSTLPGVGSQLTVTGESDPVKAIGESTQQNVSRAGEARKSGVAGKSVSCRVGLVGGRSNKNKNNKKK